MRNDAGGDGHIGVGHGEDMAVEGCGGNVVVVGIGDGQNEVVARRYLTAVVEGEGLCSAAVNLVVVADGHIAVGSNAAHVVGRHFAVDAEPLAEGEGACLACAVHIGRCPSDSLIVVGGVVVVEQNLRSGSGLHTCDGSVRVTSIVGAERAACVEAVLDCCCSHFR